ncbi:MAG: TetR/AcrR family transcriptional regulator [Novosphingobium sp.]|nr:TetR/AcrR family transcriptional regulator [Novosphingobium sp.]
MAEPKPGTGARREDNAPASRGRASQDALSHNLSGQRLGRKGRDTRERILSAAVELLYKSPTDTPISMSAVARFASLGMTSLYNYFADLTELLLAVLEPVMATAEQAYLAPLRTRWSDDELGERCTAFVAAYFAFWHRHARLLHLRNQISDRGDHRMTMDRIRATQAIIRLVVVQMDGDPGTPRSCEFAMATMLMIAIERSVTLSTTFELPALVAQNIQHDDEHFLRPGARLLELAIRDMRRGKGA